MKKTVVLKVNPKKLEREKIRLAANFIKKGGLVAFPTETVYGLGADALNSKAVLAAFEAKKRPFDNPPIVHVADIKDVYKLAKNVPYSAERLMRELWPGPLTLVFKRSEVVPDATVCGLDTIAIRMPRHEVALALIRESKCPVIGPSANLAGKPSPTTAEHVLEDLDGKIDAILDAGPTYIGVESTVLDLTVNPPQVLRPGGTPFEVLRQFVKGVRLHPVAVADKEIAVKEARSPGVRHKHYAPKAELIVVEGMLPAIFTKVRELAEIHIREGKKVGILATDETASKYDVGVVKSLGSRSDMAFIAKNLFRLLREFDAEGVDVILAEGLPMEGLGLAVMNRLRKASGYKIVRAD
jgi:L-threonylcarbamoyladenylate synthase